ncbi:hypothetical protein [Streptomyces sp. NBC_01803]|uniref:hypothetical protein n=1 Tax=Streptomyces sp. NBC_01803 TaxID=2975946 RepID=UPI002DDA0F33|nr:hypothetical protein [Streptomyces sp. NBC_01803]WSA45155.1 hypothetical protein OIE51_13635 [Streptomyces sp. NBC_01803]
MHQLPGSRNAEGAPRDTKSAYDLQVYTFRAGDENRTRALSLGITGATDLAVEALRAWLRRRGSRPATFMAMAKHFPQASAPLRKALEVLL